MPKVKLASQRLNVGGSPGGLSPVLLSSAAAGRVRAGRINPNAANVRYTDMPVPQIQTSTILDSAAKFSQVMYGEALAFQDRKDTVAADNLVNDYDQEMRRLWTGHQDDKGNFVKGYSSTEADEAVAEYGNAVTRADQALASRLSGAPENVRLKASLRLNAIKNQFVGRASVHNAKQLRVAEDRARMQSMQQAFEEVEVDPENGWRRIRNIAGQYQSPDEKVQALDNGMTYTTSKIYDEAIAAGASEDVAFTKANQFFQQHREELPELVEASVSSKLNQQKDIVIRNMEARAKKAQEAYKKRLEIQGADAVFQMLHGGPETMKNLGKFSERVMEAYEDSPAQGRRVIIESYKSSLRNLMQIDPEGGADVAWANLQQTMLKENMLIGDTFVIGELESFVKTTLKNEAKTLQAEQLSNEKQSIYSNIMKAESLSDIKTIKSSILEADIPAEAMSFLNNAAENRAKEISGEFTEIEKVKQNMTYLELRGEAEGGPTPGYKKQVYDAVENNSLKISDAKALLTRAEKFAVGAVSPDYGKLKTELKSTVSLEELYYDPRTKQVGFWNMLPEEEKEQVKQAQENFGKSEEVMQRLAVSALLNQAEIWRKNPENQGKTYMDWYTDFFSQQPEIKRGALSNFVRSSWNTLQGMGAPAPLLVEDGPLQEEVSYPWGQRSEQPVGEVVHQGSGVTVVQRQVPQTANVPAAPQSIEDYAFTTIPDNRKAQYSSMSPEQLLAMQYLREGLAARDGKQYLDEYPISSINKWVQRALSDPGFEQWKQNKIESIQ